MQITQMLWLIMLALTFPQSMLAQDAKPDTNLAGPPTIVAPLPAASAKIFYSGRMLGYMRQERPEDPSSRSDPATYFLREYHSECGPTLHCVLLGMGDNFSPAYEARLDSNGNFKSRNDARITYNTDNVALFLDAAQFDALVPGKEDFYFGAYRLWKIAHTMNDKRDASGRAGPYLADNLVLQPKDEKDREPWSAKRKVFTNHVDGITTDFAGSAMPWLVRLPFKFDDNLIAVNKAKLAGHLCAVVSNPDDIPSGALTDPKCEIWGWDETSQSFIRTENKQPIDKPRKTFSDQPPLLDNPKGDLAPGTNYGFCISGINFRAAKNMYCLPIHIEVPMFSTPYVVAHDPVNDTDVAIFAVVDPNIRSYVPKQNAGWDVWDSGPGKILKKSIDPQHQGQWIPHRIEIAALSPTIALEEALDAFQLDLANSSDPHFSGALHRPNGSVPLELSLALADLNLNRNPFPGTTVLMAQMDYDAADELARHLQETVGFATRGTTPQPAFDLVIARAETSHQTRPQEIALPVSNSRPRFVAGPAPAFSDETQEVQLPLASVKLEREPGHATAKFSISTEYCSVAPRSKECFADSTSSAWNELERQLFVGSTSGSYSQCYKAIANTKPADCASTKIGGCLMKFATCAMLQDEKQFDAEASDSAFLQQRDIWVPNDDNVKAEKDGKLDPTKAWRIQLAGASTVQGILDRIFWKDDLLTHANFSGAQLKALIKDSTAIQKDENNPLWVLRDTGGRYLKYSGLLKGDDPKPGSKDPSYYSHLEELSDTSLYRVAVSSYISNGETGYVEFAAPAEGTTEFFRNDGKGLRISVLVCEALKSGVKDKEPLYGCGDDPQKKFSNPTSSGSNPPCPRGETVADTCYAVSRAEIVGPTRSIQGLVIRDNREQDSRSEYIEAQLRELALGRDPFSDEAIRANAANGTEKQLQGYPYLDVNLTKLSISGSLNTALASRAGTANFSGVLQSDIPQPTKSEFSWITNLRVLDRRDHGRWDFGAAVDEQFDKSVQGSLTKPSSPNWSFNTLAVGPIVQFSISDPRRAPRHLITFHLTDYVRQITNTSLSLTGKNNSASFTLSQRPSQGFQPKGGYRYESGTSYLEIGGLYVRNYNVLSEISGLPGGVVCNISDSVSLSQCVGAITFSPPITTPVLHYDTFAQAGIYWDAKFDLDVLKGKWSYELTSRGNYYPKSDPVSALARVDARLGNSLVFPLFGNFSLSPTAEWRFFETEGTRDFLKRVNTSVSLTYSFHKDSRVNLLDAMRFKSTGPAAP